VYAISITATNTLSSIGATATIVVASPVPSPRRPALSALYGSESTFEFDTASGTYPVATSRSPVPTAGGHELYRQR